MMNIKKIAIIAALAGFIIIAVYSLKGTITPYVSFEEAMAGDTFVQVIGKLDKSVPVTHREGFFTMILKDDKGTSMHVKHAGLKPANMEHADSIVLLGRYNRTAQYFEADKILVKCPSRYKKKTPSQMRK